MSEIRKKYLEQLAKDVVWEWRKLFDIPESTATEGLREKLDIVLKFVNRTALNKPEAEG